LALFRGLRKRLDLAAGCFAPDVLVLDEPTVAGYREPLCHGISAPAAVRGTTILITSHYLEEIDALADRVAH